MSFRFCCMQPFGKIPVYQDDEVTLFGMCTNTIAKVLSCNFRVAEFSHQCMIVQAKEFFAHGCSMFHYKEIICYMHSCCRNLLEIS